MSRAQTPTWFIDELRYAGRENLDAEHVARYDGKEDASAASELALLQALGLTRDSVVVEFGAGTGQFSVAAAPACARLIAVDVSPVMLRRLEAKVAGGARPRRALDVQLDPRADAAARGLRDRRRRALRRRDLRAVRPARRLTGSVDRGRLEHHREPARQL